MNETILDTIICPGCGWTGTSSELHNGTCPSCQYEIGAPPYHLLTIHETMRNEDELEYNDVRMDLFLRSLFRLLEERTE